MTTAAQFWIQLEAAEKARIEAVRIKARGNHLAAQNDEPERRCYVCGASMSDPCQAVDGQIAECPRPAPRTKLRARNLNMTEQGE